MSDRCELKERACGEIISTKEGSKTVWDLISRFMCNREDLSGPIRVNNADSVRQTEATRVAEAYSKNGIFQTCVRCRDAVRNQLKAMGVV
jgi:hypothetical protein